MKRLPPLLPLLAALFLLLLGFSACGENTPKAVCPSLPLLDGTVKIPDSTIPSADSIDASVSDSVSYQTPETASYTPTDSFTANLMQLMPKDKNYMISPLSLQIALGMLGNGAEGETKTELLTVLGIDDLDAFNARTLSRIEAYEKNDRFAIRIADSLWLNETYAGGASFAPTFEKTMLDFFKADSNRVTAADAVDRINGWVKDKTDGLIDSILQKGQENFVLALANAVYFKAGWATPFSKAATADGTFTSRDGSEQTLPFMTATRSLRYISENGHTLLRLPYEDGNFAMYVLLSEDGSLPADLDALIDGMSFQYVRCRIPRFSVDFSLSVNETLKIMGAERLFDPENAELDGVTVGLNGNLFVSDILHKTVIDVDEEGTEAAAVTVIMTMATSARPPREDPIEFSADSPFFFFIRDDQNSEILFAGEYAFAEAD